MSFSKCEWRTNNFCHVNCVHTENTILPLRWNLSELWFLVDVKYSSGAKPQETWWRHQMEKLSAIMAICAGNSPSIGHKGQWRIALIFSLICAWINSWVNNREAGDLDAIAPIVTSLWWYGPWQDALLKLIEVISHNSMRSYNTFW